jgi:hypothetical protein
MLFCGADHSLPSVPRSKGCVTCVSRKTRCGPSIPAASHVQVYILTILVVDGRRPTCRTCENRKQVCGGYRREQIVFLSEGWRALGVASRPRTRSNTASANTNDDVKVSPRPTVDSPSLNTCSGTGASSAEVLALCRSPATDRSQLNVPYFVASFGTQPCQALGALRTLFQHYFPMVSSRVFHSQESSLLPTTPVVLAVDALAYGHFGTANTDPLSVRQSFQMYGRALQSMSAKVARMKRTGSGFQDLSDDDWQHFAFFCIVMAFWEVSYPSSLAARHHIRLTLTYQL